MSRTLCDWSKKDIQRYASKLLDIVSPQVFLCEKCARTACEKKYLCRPREIAKIREDVEE